MDASVQSNSVSRQAHSPPPGTAASDISLLNGDGEGDGLGARWRLWRRRRCVLAALCFLGLLSMYWIRSSFSVALVAMTSGSRACARSGHSGALYTSSAFVLSVDASKRAEFDWDSRTQGLLLSAFFYGYAASLLPAGWLVARAGTARVMGAGIAGSALLATLAPAAARLGGAWLLLAVRVGQGVFQGAVFPSVQQLLARWAPPLERSRMVACIVSGCHVGIVLSMAASGLLTTYSGWPSVFYVCGALGCLWWVLWWLQIVDSPEVDPRIGVTERDFIKKKIGAATVCSKVVSHPWRRIFTSAPYLAKVMALFCCDWTYYTLLTQIPMYLKDTLGYDLREAGFVSALPFVVMGALQVAAGALADWLERRRLLSTTNVRKLFACGGSLVVVLCLLLSTALADAVAVMACITVGVAFIAFVSTAISVNILDLAPLHASVLTGASSTIANTAGILSPQLTGFIVRNKSAAEWRVVFYVASAMSLVGAGCFALFGSGERQPWADDGLEPSPDGASLLAAETSDSEEPSRSHLHGAAGDAREAAPAAGWASTAVAATEREF